MSRPRTIKTEAKEENITAEVVIEATESKVDSEFAKILAIYKAKSPKKYELKKEELLKKLALNK